MPRVRFELTIPVFEQEKTFRAQDRADIVSGKVFTDSTNISITLPFQSFNSVTALTPCSNSTTTKHVTLMRKLVTLHTEISAGKELWSLLT
jgi:hypothetical protein